jgi:hypothetical protein
VDASATDVDELAVVGRRASWHGTSIGFAAHRRLRRVKSRISQTISVVCSTRE